MLKATIEIYSEPTNKLVTTKRELVERQNKIWFHRKRMPRFRKTFMESMPDRMKASTTSEGGQTSFWTASACDENFLKVASLVS